MNRKSLLVVIIAIITLVAFGVGYSANRHFNHQSAGQTSNKSTNSGKAVDLSGQQLTVLPSSVTNQADITDLNISNNQLTGLPESIAKMTELGTLNAENNRLETLPAAIGQLKNLQNADFSNNRLTSLPPELTNLTQLKTLKLGGYKGLSADIKILETKLPNTQVTD